MDLTVLQNCHVYLPNYLQFNEFFNIHNFLFDINDIVDYEMLENSLDEIDYPLFGDGEGKCIKYIQAHQVPT